MRIGLAGGGTDVSPYSDLYGGAILNATISLYAWANIEPTNDGKIVLEAADINQRLEFDSIEELEIDGNLDLLKGVYNRIVKQYTKKPLSFKLTTYVESPFGTGLGTSSTVTVAILGAFAEWLNIPLGEYDMAQLAYEIERVDLGMAGGKQDQYAATFGGFNFMEFYADDKVIVNPLRIKQDRLSELESTILLYYTGTSRLSSKIIEGQSSNFEAKKNKSVEAAHKLKEQAYLMKEALLTGKLDEIGHLLDFGWTFKKQTAGGVTNPQIDEIYEAARSNGITGGKISGAGGGGYMMFYAPGTERYRAMNALRKFGGELRRFNFEQDGLRTWKSK